MDYHGFDYTDLEEARKAIDAAIKILYRLATEEKDKYKPYVGMLHKDVSSLMEIRSAMDWDRD